MLEHFAFLLIFIVTTINSLSSSIDLNVYYSSYNNNNKAFILNTVKLDEYVIKQPEQKYLQETFIEELSFNELNSNQSDYFLASYTNGSRLGYLNDKHYVSNMTQIHQPQTHNVPLYLKILASIFYIISMILGIGGNTMVLLIFMFYQPVKTVTNFFIINLAISDLIFGILCIPSTYITAYLIQHWPFSGFLCVFLNYMQTVSVTLTVYTLILITIDKFWALVKPLKLRISIRICKYLILLSWLFSLFISLPIALFTKLTFQFNAYENSSTSSSSFSSSLNDSSLLSINGNNNNNNNSIGYFDYNNPQCNEKWPDNLSNLNTVYNISLLLIQYFIPLIILSFCYAKIGFVLRKSKAPGESDQNRDEKMTKSKKKILKMCFMMVLTFMIFWAPLHFLNVYRFYDEQIAYSKYFGDLFFVCHILAVSRSFVNPFIYAWINPKFRHGFKYFICCFCLKEKKYLNTLAYQNTELFKLNSFYNKNSLNSVRNATYEQKFSSYRNLNTNDMFNQNYASRNKSQYFRNHNINYPQLNRSELYFSYSRPVSNNSNEYYFKK